jgi:hypothetical protein
LWGQLRSYWKEKQQLRSRKPRLMTVGIRCAAHATPSIHKKLATSPSGSHSVGIVRSRTKATEFSFSLVYSAKLRNGLWKVKNFLH